MIEVLAGIFGGIAMIFVVGFAIGAFIINSKDKGNTLYFADKDQAKIASKKHINYYCVDEHTGATYFNGERI